MHSLPLSHSYFNLLLANAGKCGSRCYAPFRGDEMEARLLKPMFDLGQLALMPFSARDEDSIRASMAQSDVVINLIGKHYETKGFMPHRTINGKPSRVNYTFDEVHCDVPRTLARLAKEAGVDSFIHMSALQADLNSKSAWSRSKAKGESAVREEFPDAIIVKPATVFGPEDRFLNWIGDTMEQFGAMPLLDGGNALVQPVYAVDIAKAIMGMVNHKDDFRGQTFELAGPAEYSYREVVEFVQDVIATEKPVVDVPSKVASMVGSVVGETINPMLTADGIEQMKEDVLPSNDPDVLTFAHLGLTPEPMDKIAFDYMHRFRPGGHFTQVEGYH
jgi:NADH dehydrogenase (ubiquinone) 1 alpha subcomplex subunit 9